MVFNVFARAVEDTVNLTAQVVDNNTDTTTEVVDVVHRTHNELLDAIGVGNILPTPIKSFTDKAFDTNRDMVSTLGHGGANLLRSTGGFLHGHGKTEHNEYGKEDPDNDDLGEHNSSDEPPGDFDPGPYPDLPDHRDHYYEPPNRPIGPYVDLRPATPEIYDQGQMNSCTAHAVAAAFAFAVMKQNLPSFNPSRLYIWYYARKKLTTPHNATQFDVGSYLRDAIKSIGSHEHGVCSESDWPYEVSPCDKNKRFNNDARATQQPPVDARSQGAHHLAKRYRRISTQNLIQNLEHCLNEGFPFVFGFNSYGLMKLEPVRTTGRGLRLPTAKEQKGDKHRHSLLAVGYRQKEKEFIVRNSWGEEWGDRGHFYMPYECLKHCYDYWTIRFVESESD
ncbi:cysteine proteinase [Xylaria cf. heliscus]|nr:cysteine proteinase [Xylaria cf. heliscus]